MILTERANKETVGSWGEYGDGPDAGPRHAAVAPNVGVHSAVHNKLRGGVAIPLHAR